MAAGDFTATTVPQFTYAIQKVAKDSPVLTRETVRDAFIKAIVSQDNSEVQKHFRKNDTNKCVGYKIVWQKEFVTEATRTTPENWFDLVCDFDGAEGESTSTTLTGIQDFTATFKVADENCPNLIEKVKKIAEGQLGALNSIKKAMNNYFAAKLDAAKGVQKYTETGDYINLATTANSGTLSKVNPGNVNHIDFIPYLEKVNYFNQFNSPMIIDNFAFSKFLSTAGILAGTKSKDENQQMLREYLGNYISAPKDFLDNSLANNFYMLERGVLSTVFHNNFSTQPKTYMPNGGKIQTLYSIPLGFDDADGNPIMVDVQYKEESVTNADGRTCHLEHVWHFRVMAEVHQNPNSGNGRTGVLKYLLDPTVTKVTNPFFPTYS